MNSTKKYAIPFSALALISFLYSGFTFKDIKDDEQEQRIENIKKSDEIITKKIEDFEVDNLDMTSTEESRIPVIINH